MLTGICPRCKTRRLLVVHSIWMTDAETNERVHVGTQHVIRKHECGADLTPKDVLTLEDAYAERKNGEERRLKPTDIRPALRKRKVSL